MALDYGTTRIGVAMSDPLGIVGSPLCVLDADGALVEIRRIVEEYRPEVIVIGIPIGRSGAHGLSAEGARTLGKEVEETTGIPIAYVDERYTTVTAEKAMLEANVRRRDRRRKVDKVAAALILQHYLEGPHDHS